MFVPLNYAGAKGWIFNLVCPGNAFSVPHEGLLLLKSATVNGNLGFGEVCKEKHVYVAYNHEWGIFEVSNITGEMVRRPVAPYLTYDPVAWEWETQAEFFQHNNITPHWINANYTWGWLDNTTNQWTGAVGLIERDEADYAIFAFAGTHPRSKVAAFSPGIKNGVMHWLTRYPLKKSPMWNLLGLFTKVYNSQMSITQHDLT